MRLVHEVQYTAQQTMRRETVFDPSCWETHLTRLIAARVMLTRRVSCALHYQMPGIGSRQHEFEVTYPGYVREWIDPFDAGKLYAVSFGVNAGAETVHFTAISIADVAGLVAFTEQIKHIHLAPYDRCELTFSSGSMVQPIR